MTRHKTPGLLVAVSLLALPGVGRATDRACGGTTLPSTVRSASHTLKLNGLGLREVTVFDVDVYVAGLFVKSTGQSAAELLAKDEAKSVVLRFVRDVSAEQVRKEIQDGLKANAPSADQANVRKLMGWLVGLKSGQVLRFDYRPGEGLTVSAAGRKRGVIAGIEFARAVLSILIGADPLDEDVKAGMLGAPCG